MKTIKNCQGTMETCPPLEIGVDTVYVRENIKRVTIDEMEMWQYDETQYTLEEYNIFKVTELSSIPTNQLIIRANKSHILTPPESVVVTDLGDHWNIVLNSNIKLNDDNSGYNYETLEYSRAKDRYTYEEIVYKLSIVVNDMFQFARAPESSIEINLMSNVEMLRIINNLCDKVKELEAKLKI